MARGGCIWHNRRKLERDESERRKAAPAIVTRVVRLQRLRRDTHTHTYSFLFSSPALFISVPVSRRAGELPHYTGCWRQGATEF